MDERIATLLLILVVALASFGGFVLVYGLGAGR